MKNAINKITGLQAGYTDEWVVRDNDNWRPLTELELSEAEAEHAIQVVGDTKVEIEQAIKELLDSKAVELRYDNMMSARSYAGYANPFQAEASALAEWCSACWLKAGELESLGVMLTVDEVLEAMPKYV